MPIWLLCFRWKNTSGGGSNWNNGSKELLNKCVNWKPAWGATIN